jgi:hypothetical protein
MFLEFSKDFEKSRKIWWGRRGREGGLGGWWVIQIEIAARSA